LFLTKAQRSWMMDCEFIPLSQQKGIIVLQFAVHNLLGEKVVSTTIDYNLSAENLVCEALRFRYRLDRPRTRESIAYQSLASHSIFKRIYKSNRTHGLTLIQLRVELVRAGYNERTHTILSWSTTADLSFFRYLIRGGNEMIADKVEIANERGFTDDINLRFIAKDMLPANIESSSLRCIHFLLYGHTSLKFHDADEDTRATIDILHLVVQWRTLGSLHHTERTLQQVRQVANCLYANKSYNIGTK
jgi:hypothetical protein